MIVSSSPDRQAFYEKLRRDGVSHNMAEMCALQQPPGTSGSDRAFMEGSTGKRYIAQLGRKGFKPGTDPQAWVSGVDDLVARCRAQNKDCEVAGRMKHRSNALPPPPPIDVAPDILQREIKREIAAEPGLQFKMKPQEIVERVKQRIVPPWKRGKKLA